MRDGCKFGFIASYFVNDCRKRFENEQLYASAIEKGFSSNFAILPANVSEILRDKSGELKSVMITSRRWFDRRQWQRGGQETIPAPSVTHTSLSANAWQYIDPVNVPSCI